MEENATNKKIGMTAVLCVAMSMMFGQWEYTFAGGVAGAWLSCFALKQLEMLWSVTIAAAIVVVAQTSEAAFAAAVCLFVTPLVSVSSSLMGFQTVRGLSEQG